MSAQQSSSSRIYPGQLIRLTCRIDPLLSNDFLVGADGSIQLPFVGKVGVAGDSTEHAKSRILGKLRATRTISESDLTLQALGRGGKLVSFAGAVTLAAEIPYSKGLRLSDILAIAKPTPSAHLDGIEITDRDGRRISVRFGGSASNEMNPEIRAGDAIFIPAIEKAAEVFVLGEVKTPGNVEHFDGLTARQAVALAGGLNASADTTAVEILRDGVRLDVLNFELSYDRKLERGDVVRINPLGKGMLLVVTGDVVRPGSLAFVQGIRLTDAIERCGGIRPGNDGSEIYVVKREGGNLKRTHYSLRKIRERQQPNPILNIGESVEVAVPKRRRS